MSNEYFDKLIKTTEISHADIKDNDTAHLVVHHNKVLGSHLVPGLNVEVNEIQDGVDVELKLDDNIKIKKPVHICFGMIPETGLQKINMKVFIGCKSEIYIYAHCTFPNAVDVQHIMDADIIIGEHSVYSYFERHIHGSTGGINVVPKAKVTVEPYARFKTEFELLKGRVGKIDIDYETVCKEHSRMEMSARINGRADDKIKIREIGSLIGEYAAGGLFSRVAVQDNAIAEIINRLTATAAYARGHVDCKEIIQGNAKASAVPIVDVQHPKAHITHEAAIGSVDSKELETLMARGLTEDEATDVIIEGLLT